MNLPLPDDATIRAMFCEHAPSSPEVVAERGAPSGGCFEIEVPGFGKYQLPAADELQAALSVLHALQLPGSPERYGVVVTRIPAPAVQP